jgi:hypothetical protein
MYLYTLPKYRFAARINVPYPLLSSFIEQNKKISCCHAPDTAELMNIRTSNLQTLPRRDTMPSLTRARLIPRIIYYAGIIKPVCK